MQRILFLALLLTTTYAQAQTQQTQAGSHKGISLQIGTMGLGNPRFSDNRIGLERGRLGIMINWNHDERDRSYGDGSADCFQLRTLTLNPRIYSQTGARGFFGEAYAGLGIASLRSEYTYKRDERSWGLAPVTGLGIGYRFGRRSQGFYGEIGYRRITTLARMHMQHTDANPDAGTGRDTHSWQLAPGNFSGRLYWGIGYTF
jgi:hypothetical protein